MASFSSAGVCSSTEFQIQHVPEDFCQVRFPFGKRKLRILPPGVADRPWEMKGVILVRAEDRPE
jgi:hypothetical protein